MAKTVNSPQSAVGSFNPESRIQNPATSAINKYIKTISKQKRENYILSSQAYKDRYPIAEAICKKYGLPLDIVQSNKRDQLLVKVRIEISKAMRERGFSYQQIGNFLGGRGHATIINYFKINIREEKMQDIPFLQQVRERYPDAENDIVAMDLAGQELFKTIKAELDKGADLKTLHDDIDKYHWICDYRKRLLDEAIFSSTFAINPSPPSEGGDSAAGRGVVP